MSPNFPFLGDTNYRDSFKPFKVLKTPGEHGLTKVKKKKNPSFLFSAAETKKLFI